MIPDKSCLKTRFSLFYSESWTCCYGPLGKKLWGLVLPEAMTSCQSSSEIVGNEKPRRNANSLVFNGIYV